MVTESEGGIKITKSNGIIENSQITKIKSRFTSSYGGGLYLTSSAQIRTKNLDLIGNSASVGGGFYCGTATLNMVGGRIHQNTASTAGAGQCDSTSCAFFSVGVDFKDNKPTGSNCRGIPISNKLQKI